MPDYAQLALQYLVAGNASDALLAHAARELLGAAVPLSGGFSAPVESSPGLKAPAERAVRPAQKTVRLRGGAHIPGLRDEVVRVNVRVGGRRTSISVPSVEWRVLERRFGGRGALLEAAQEAAEQFTGRGSRSAWVMEVLEARTLREGAVAAQDALPSPPRKPDA